MLCSPYGSGPPLSPPQDSPAKAPCLQTNFSRVHLSLLLLPSLRSQFRRLWATIERSQERRRYYYFCPLFRSVWRQRIEDLKNIGGASAPTPLHPQPSQVSPAAQVGVANPLTSGHWQGHQGQHDTGRQSAGTDGG